MSMITPQYYINQAIDTIQGTKSFFLKAMVTDEKVLKPMQEFIDLQTSFAKNAFRVTNDAMTESAALFQKMTTTSK
jgi:hypothetical protein